MTIYIYTEPLFCNLTILKPYILGLNIIKNPLPQIYGTGIRKDKEGGNLKRVQFRFFFIVLSVTMYICIVRGGHSSFVRAFALLASNYNETAITQSLKRTVSRDFRLLFSLKLLSEFNRLNSFAIFSFSRSYSITKSEILASV